MSAKVLFVDDEPEFIRAHIDTLIDAGYIVRHVASYIEALAALEQETFDLIVLDLILPSNDDNVDIGSVAEPSAEVGLKLHKVIREKLGKTTIPIIFFTVVGEMETRTQIWEVEQKYKSRPEILVKPKLPSSLLSIIRKYVGG